MPAKETEEKAGSTIEDMFTLRIYYPAGGNLQMEEEEGAEEDTADDGCRGGDNRIS